MASSEKKTPDVKLSVPETSPLAAFLSYLVPGLGQMYQGRVAKGVLFLLSLYALFFFGMYLGNWRNVYIYKQKAPVPQAGVNLGSMFSSKARFFGQVWIGVAAWPAILQYNSATKHPLFGDFQTMPTQAEIKAFLQNSDKRPDLGWMYTVIAGMLNIFVIYDAYAGPALGEAEQKPNKDDDPDPDQEGKRNKDTEKGNNSNQELTLDKDEKKTTNIKQETSAK
ncbi:MAG: DUF6677 family protein [Gemmataceae bacterium]